MSNQTTLCHPGLFWFLIVCRTFLELEHKISPKSTYACKRGKVQRAFMQKSLSFHERYIEFLPLLNR